MTATSWTRIGIVDSENQPIVGDAKDALLATFRRFGEMPGAFFVNPETGEAGDWDYLPEIDWTDFAQSPQ